MRKLARSQLRAFTQGLWKKQGGVCPVCTEPIDIKVKGEAVADHNHETGEIRGILHRSCNAALGKVDNAAGRWGAKSMEYKNIIPFLENMIEYYKSPGAGVIYPFHKTEEEKRALRNKRQREARARAQAKQRVRERHDR